MPGSLYLISTCLRSIFSSCIVRKFMNIYTFLNASRVFASTFFPSQKRSRNIRSFHPSPQYLLSAYRNIILFHVNMNFTSEFIFHAKGVAFSKFFISKFLIILLCILLQLFPPGLLLFYINRCGRNVVT